MRMVAQLMQSFEGDGEKGERKAIELFDIPESDGMNNVDSITMLPGKTFALRKLPVSIRGSKIHSQVLGAARQRLPWHDEGYKNKRHATYGCEIEEDGRQIFSAGERSATSGDSGEGTAFDGMFAVMRDVE